MKQILQKLIPYTTFLAIVFFLIPISTIMGAPKELMITLLIVANPIACLGSGAVFGIKHGFRWYFLMLILFVFYGETALIYVVIYLFFSAGGLGIGCVIRKFSKH